MKKLLACAMMASFSAGAIDIAGWKGETIYVQLPKNEKVGEAPKGITVKTGVLRDVKYCIVPKKPEYSVAADRVEWTKKFDANDRLMLAVTIAPDAKAGNYKFGDVSLRVVDRTLPAARDWKFYLDLWQHPWAVARTAKAKPFSSAHYAAMKPLWEMLAAAGQKVLTITMLDLPWNHQCFDGYYTMIKRVRMNDGSWKFDYRIFDEYVEFGRKCGIGPHIACYTMCPWGYFVSWENENGEPQKQKMLPGTKEFNDFWTPFLKDFAAHLKAKGWLKDTFIAMDERSPEDMRNIINLVKSVSPEFRIATAGNIAPEKFAGFDFGNYSQALHLVNDAFINNAQQWRKDGKITTCYVCCGPDRPNTFMDSELVESFWVGFYPAASGLDGLLRWAYNSWPQDAVSDASYGTWRSGDTFLVYPDGSPSISFLELINGIQHSEKYWILRKEGKMDAELDALAKKYDVKAALKDTSKPRKYAPVIEETKALLNML